MPIEDVIEQRAGRRLAALAQPSSRDHRVEIRSPHTGHVPWLFSHCHVARRRTGDHGETGVQRTRVVSTEKPQSPSVRIDEADAHGAPCRETEFSGCCRSEIAGNAADCLRMIGKTSARWQISKAD